MIVTTQQEITNFLYRGPLDFQVTLGDTSTPHEVEEADWPNVGIGQPQWWNVADVYRTEGKPLPAIISLLLSEADFFLVQFTCSFLPTRDPNTYVQRARFAVRLTSKNPEAPKPIAFDLHPLQVWEEVRRDVHIAISPSLKFKELVEIKAGEAALQIQHNQLLPIVTAVGALESNFSWDLQAMKEMKTPPLLGVRCFHALVKRPHGAEGVHAKLDVVADVVTRRRIFQAAVHSANIRELSCLICTEICE